MRQYKHLSIGFALLLLFVGHVVHAQIMGNSQPDPVQYTVSPDTPGPNQKVFIDVEGVGSFLGNSTLTWQQNGKVVSSGVGKATYSFTTGGIGDVTRIHLTIDSPIQGTITHDFVFNPSMVNLVWEADTSVPPFYLGKALYSAGSSARVVAFPVVVSGGAQVANSALSFQWSRKDALVPEQSGIGKNVFLFDGDQLQKEEQVGVDVYMGNTKVGHSAVTIPVTDPQVVLYVQDPLRGEVLDNGLSGSQSLVAKEVTLKAEPYYFANLSKKHGALSYTWTLNNNETTGPDSAQGLLTLRQTGSGLGAANIDVSVQNTNTDTFMQAAETSLQLAFGQQTGSALSSFFGL